MLEEVLSVSGEAGCPLQQTLNAVTFCGLRINTGDPGFSHC